MPQKYDAMEANKQEDPGSKTEKERSQQTPTNTRKKMGIGQRTKKDNCSMNADDQKEKPTLTNKKQTRLSMHGPRR